VTLQETIKQIQRFSTMKVVVLGDVMLDVYEFCSTEASKPINSEKPGKRAYTAQQTVRALGGAGNVAANLASLGVSTSLIGVTGNDGRYFTMQQISDELALRHCFIRDRSRPTTTKNRLYIDNEYILRRDDESAEPIEHETAMTLLNEALCELDGAQAVILSDYAKGIFSEQFAQQVIAACRDKGVPTIVDFKPVNRGIFYGASLIAPNSVEAEAILPGFNEGIDSVAGALEVLQTLHGKLGCERLVVTLGERGICGYDGETMFHVPANKVEEVDAVGCGDTVRAVLATAHALGFSLEDAASLANDAAAVIVQKPATAMVDQGELIAFLEAKDKVA